MQKLAFGTQLLHVDTTSFSVHGQYEGDDCQPAIEITLGHPKDGRWDLKQFVLAMVTNQCGIPLFVQAHSGNKSDKKRSSKPSRISNLIWISATKTTSWQMAHFSAQKISISLEIALYGLLASPQQLEKQRSF
jgi:hypothetical protein